jgi:three-Cys-motif partner protein
MSGIAPDGLYTPEIKKHSLEKIRRHNYYAAIFSMSMRKKWPQRVYIGLYCGPGRAVVAESGEIVETSAMGVVQQEVPFTKYIFVDSDPQCIEALGSRIKAANGSIDVELICRNVNESVDQVIKAMPSFSKEAGLLSLCFVDPFRADLDFDVLRQLGRYRMDFLIMLPLGFDIRRNLARYLHDEADDRIGKLIDRPNWRTEWRASLRPEREFLRFLLEKFDDAMESLGYKRREMKDTVSVKVAGMGVYLYSLALYSKHAKGIEFWKTTLAGTDPQFEMPL